MAKFAWRVHGRQPGAHESGARFPTLGPARAAGLGRGRLRGALRGSRGSARRPAPGSAPLEAARLGDLRAGGTRGPATREIRDLRAPRSGYSEHHTPRRQASGDQPLSSLPSKSPEERSHKTNKQTNKPPPNSKPVRVRWLIPLVGNWGGSEHHEGTLGRRNGEAWRGPKLIHWRLPSPAWATAGQRQ